MQHGWLYPKGKNVILLVILKRVMLALHHHDVYQPLLKYHYIHKNT